MDRTAVRRIADALSLGPGDAVLEIGPGRGALTDEILARVGVVSAVELDARLADALDRRFGSERLRLVRGDILRVPLSGIPNLLGRPDGTSLVVAGNLPYSISKPVAMKLVAERGHVSRAVLMFQREVAQRLVARPGNRRYGPLTVLVGRAFRVSRLFDLPPGAFSPRPAIVSTVTGWERCPATDLSPVLENRLRACLRAAFRHRRRTLFNNLRASLPGGETEAIRLLDEARLDGSDRAEMIPPEGFVRIAERWPGADPI